MNCGNKLMLQFTGYYQIGANILCRSTAVKCVDRNITAMKLTKSLVPFVIYNEVPSLEPEINEVPYLPKCTTTLI